MDITRAQALAWVDSWDSAFLDAHLGFKQTPKAKDFDSQSETIVRRCEDALELIAACCASLLAHFKDTPRQSELALALDGTKPSDDGKPKKKRIAPAARPLEEQAAEEVQGMMDRIDTDFPTPAPEGPVYGSSEPAPAPAKRPRGRPRKVHPDVPAMTEDLRKAEAARTGGMVAPPPGYVPPPQRTAPGPGYTPPPQMVGEDDPEMEPGPPAPRVPRVATVKRAPVPLPSRA